jgi:DNA repair protein RecO (recombination protein O)
MKSRSYSSEGVVLAKRNYGEADRILILYSKDRGKLSLMAKGVRRPKSKKRGHIEIFNKVSFSASLGRGIDLMTEAEVIDDFSDIRNSLKKVSLAYYFCEVVGKITHEGEPNHEVYNLIVESLENLRVTSKLKDLRLEFVLKLLTILGYWPKGKPLLDHDEKLEEVLERNINSVRVGKRILEI